MATESSYQRTEQLPPNYLAQFYSGVPGANVPGMMPLLNQELVNRMMGFGVEGANPYTYSGERIADFSPAQREGMRMTAEGMGSYLPYFQRGEQLTEGGLGEATGAYGDARNLIDQAVQAGETSTEEATNILRMAPQVGASATRKGLGQIRQAGGTLGAAENIAGGAGVDLGESQNVVRGALGGLDRSAEVGAGSTGQFDPRGISNFYNPFEDQVVDQTMEDVRKGLAQGDIARRAGEVGAGAFGGSRSRLQGQELAESAARGAAQQVGAIRSGGYQDAARRAQGAFEAQQGRQAGQANLLSGLSSQQAGIGSQLGQLGLAGQGAQLGQAGALGQLAGQRAGMGTQIAGMGGNLAGLYGTTAGGLGSLGGNLANVYGGAGRDVFGSGSQLGQLGMGAGAQMAGYGQSTSGLLGTDIGRMMSMGGMQQGQDQRGLDLNYGNFVGQYNQPLQTIGQIGGLATGMAPGMGGTAVSQTQAGNSSNPLMQAAGTALTAYGALKA